MPIYLIVDNAGRHGKDEVVKAYKDDLARTWNVIIIHQRPRTPESNVLDLGVWMHLQYLVELAHIRKRCTLEALWESMNYAWGTISQQALTNMYGHGKKSSNSPSRLGEAAVLWRKGGESSSHHHQMKQRCGTMTRRQRSLSLSHDEAAGDEVIDWPGGQGSAT